MELITAYIFNRNFQTHQYCENRQSLRLTLQHSHSIKSVQFLPLKFKTGMTDWREALFDNIKLLVLAINFLARVLIFSLSSDSTPMRISYWFGKYAFREVIGSIILGRGPGKKRELLTMVRRFWTLYKHGEFSLIVKQRCNTLLRCSQRVSQIQMRVYLFQRTVPKFD